MKLKKVGKTMSSPIKTISAAMKRTENPCIFQAVRHWFNASVKEKGNNKKNFEGKIKQLTYVVSNANEQMPPWQHTGSCPGLHKVALYWHCGLLPFARIHGYRIPETEPCPFDFGV